MIAALLVAVQATAGLGSPVMRPVAPAQEDTIPVVTLSEALEAAAHVDPDYVSALRQVGDAAWVRRGAWSAFFLPSITFNWSFSQFSPEQFNIGTNSVTDRLTTFSLQGSYDVFRGGAKFHDLAGSAAGVDGAAAGELQARYSTALATESDYYDAIAQRQLLAVAQERVRRATEQLSVARARVLSGAAVQTDSLQLLLELTRAQVDELSQNSALTIARLQLGRRIGRDGPVDAAPLDAAAFRELPLSLASAVAEATSSSPALLVARAQQRLADAAFKRERATYLPTISLFGQWQGFDDDLIPDATNRTVVGAALSFPLFDGGGRQLRVYRASTARRVADAAAADALRAAARDVTEAYETYTTARASTDLAVRGVTVATENLRVQTERYTAGATTIIDLITAQVDLAEAEVGLVQARFATRLALAGVEAILGRRLF
ncbi:MAG: TolC family protein [Gemmatimonadota bacterium]